MKAINAALEKIRCIDGFTMKVIMAVLMLMDHLYYFFPAQFPTWFHMVARLVAPTFAFLIAEGMYHTSNRKRYIGRLFLFGGVMIAADVVLFFIFRSFPSNSILLSLAITASMIYCLDKRREARRDGESAVKWVLLLVLLTFASILFEGMFICQITGLVCYYLRHNKVAMCLAYVGAMGAFLAILGMLGDVQALSLLSFIPFLLYNGKRGVSNAFSKYFFYVFYPAHIWILFVAKQLIVRLP